MKALSVIAHIVGMNKKPHYVKEWRKHRNLSQDRLASRIERGQSWLSQLERFDIDYTQETLEALSNALSCTPADLIMRDPAKEDFIWSIWDKVPETERPRVIEIIETFTRKAS